MITLAKCQSCNWTGPADLCGPLKNAWERVRPGDVMPAGECPVCNASAMIVEDDEGPSVKIVTRTDPALATHIESKASARTLADLMRFARPDRHFFVQLVDDRGYRVGVTRPFPETPTGPDGYLRLIAS
ncbi:MAG: hypothetical protein OYH76_13230 [Defluviicoccus sp.]|nr:hypothetical protein [Defluviicoccus sp.]MDE0276851.1 hypothetical protein [Defluviicoccus sp.]